MNSQKYKSMKLALAHIAKASDNERIRSLCNDVLASPDTPEGEPEAWRFFDGEDYQLYGYLGNEDFKDIFEAQNPSSEFKNWVVPLYMLEEM